MSPTTLPGAETIKGVTYLNTTSGDLRRVDQLSAKDTLVHEQVYRMIDFAKGLAAEIARFKAHTFSDLDALDEMLAQEYGVARRGAKGNRSFTSVDGRYKVAVKINVPEVVGPELQQAKALIDEIVLEKGEGADPVLAALVAQAFDVGKAGRVNTDMLRRLKKLEIDDPRWPSIQRAIGDAITDGVSKAYITFHQWRDEAGGGWKMIPLDMAAVEITADAFDHPSLRRQVEELTAELEQVHAVDRGLIVIDGIDISDTQVDHHLADLLLQVAAERRRQDDQWAGPDHDDSHDPSNWYELISQHAARLVLRPGIDQRPMADYRDRLIKIAALALAAVQSHDRKEG